MNRLTPIRFDNFLKGGSTYPWNVSCIDESAAIPEEISCVVKLFKPKHIVDSHSIGKEFICSALAREFDLDTPDAYLINIYDEDFRKTLPDEAITELANKHIGYTFCSRLVNASIINEELRTNTFSIWDCATLFGFDCMILNADRWGHHKKANLLTDDDGFILIDHELSFHFIDREDDDAYNLILKNLQDNTWPSAYTKHLFYNRLKRYKGSKKNLFDTFGEYLDKLDVNKVRDLIVELKSFDISTGESERLIQYLYTLKQNSHKFCTILLSLIA